MGRVAPTDWTAWHAAYDDPASSLSRRRRSVQAQISSWLDSTPGNVRVVSVCAGDGRDLLEVLAGRDDADRVSAVLLELDPALAALAAERAAAESLHAVEVRCVDAGTTASYAGAVPADLVLLCGIFGNVDETDLRTTVALAPAFCASGATVVWTRGRSEGEREVADDVRDWFARAGFAEVGFDRPDDASYRVGTHRLVAEPRPLPDATTFFTFRR
ncbi:MAG: hypothetical protein JWO46_234 [Nocardioidaceae bacterium]|nr:hypothetical protein [Nocardioidaceae bacterium]